jgi:uncharacterized protein (TIGR00255 family)
MTLIRSMTAYGRAEHQARSTTVTVELRAFNHRYRDINIRIPRNYLGLEEDVKNAISGKVSRGRVEVSVQIAEDAENACQRLELNVPLVKGYLDIFKELTEHFGLQQEIRLDTLCQLKDVILMQPESVELENVKPVLQQGLFQALDSLDRMRRAEGEMLTADLMHRLELLTRYTDEVDLRAPQVLAAYRTRLRENISRLVEAVPVDEDRLAQEVAIFSERSDITEELVRIRSHLKQFHEYLAVEEAVGRRLDFLVQEINREVNTLSSKASDSVISGIAVEMKSELEKMREQIQNVE